MHNLKQLGHNIQHYENKSNLSNGFSYLTGPNIINMSENDKQSLTQAKNLNN